jgi:hypothetical protein
MDSSEKSASVTLPNAWTRKSCTDSWNSAPFSSQQAYSVYHESTWTLTHFLRELLDMGFVWRSKHWVASSWLIAEYASNTDISGK